MTDPTDDETVSEEVEAEQIDIDADEALEHADTGAPEEK